VDFDVVGAEGPAEEAKRQQKTQAAIQGVLQIEQAKIQMAQVTGEKPRLLDLEEMQRTLIKQGGFADADVFFADPAPGVAPGSPEAGAVPGSPDLVEGQPDNPLAAVAG